MTIFFTLVRHFHNLFETGLTTEMSILTCQVMIKDSAKVRILPPVGVYEDSPA